VTYGTFIPLLLWTAEYCFRYEYFVNYSCHFDTLPGPLFETYDTTPKCCIILSPLGFRIFLLPFTGTFQLSLMVLVCYRFQFIFKVWSWCLQILCLISNRHYSRYLLVLSSSSYGTITLYDLTFQKNSVELERGNVSLITPHVYYIAITDSVCLELFSLAVTNSISIDFFSFGY
jgi:hypothetical protein